MLVSLWLCSWLRNVKREATELIRFPKWASKVVCWAEFVLRRCVSLDTLKTKSASIMRDSKSDWSARLAHKPLGVDGGQFYAIGLQSSNSQGLEEEFHVFPIMKGPLQYSEEINGELPFFMPNFLCFLWVHTYTHPLLIKLHLQLGVLILCGWWGAAGANTPTLKVPPAVKI